MNNPDTMLLIWQVLVLVYLAGWIYTLIRLRTDPLPWSKKWPLLILLFFVPIGLLFYGPIRRRL